MINAKSKRSIYKNFQIHIIENWMNCSVSVMVYHLFLDETFYVLLLHKDGQINLPNQFIQSVIYSFYEYFLGFHLAQ